ncbi:ACP S-malonyltransferase [Kocuria palustris]|uniref:ACP S-malonyltransferase n=1 Tax=Kocuria palustris TaxID=71999 RepID=UPI002468DE6B|nr:ACP S-malonyltransferase [Kocuria palustris]MDH5151308.1 ACP S-malonyltransferase [Kocuria palustris]
MIVILCPGQGAQKPGMLAEWLPLPGVREHLERLSRGADLDLIHYGTEADAETIKDTAVAQPLIVAAGLVAARLLRSELDGRDDLLFAGHSVGEITASALAGALSEDDAMSFVRTRATAMAQAAAAAPTGMSAVLSPQEDVIREAIEAAGLTPANANGSGQIVAAGSLEALEAFAANPPERARVVPLKVAGAFHTDYMAPALEPLRELAGSLSPQDPASVLLSNRDGQALASGRANLESLIEQVCRPVRWDLCMEEMKRREVTQLIELPPAGTLVGLAKRAMRGVPAVAVTSAEALEDARSALS